MKKFVCVVAILLSLACFTEAHVRDQIRDGSVRCRGVNLGGWLVAEHWLTHDSSLWNGVDSGTAGQGELITMKKSYNLPKMKEQVRQHRSSYISESDIKSIHDNGLNTVRVPVGYWLSEEDKSGDWSYFTEGGISYLDTLIKQWALRQNVAVLISIHGAPGSQNGFDHSAPASSGSENWHQSPQNIQRTINFAVFLAKRYKDDAAFLGIGLLNEPSFNINYLSTLNDYYNKAIQAVRAVTNCVITISPFVYHQKPTFEADIAKKYGNIWVEWHKYVTDFSDYKGMNENDILNKALGEINYQIQQMNNNGVKVFIGEWSLSVTSTAPFSDTTKFRDLASKFFKAVNQAQAGYAFWNWKSAGDQSASYNGWSLRNLIKNGYIKIA